MFHEKRQRPRRFTKKITSLLHIAFAVATFFRSRRSLPSAAVAVFRTQPSQLWLELYVRGL